MAVPGPVPYPYAMEIRSPVPVAEPVRQRASRAGSATYMLPFCPVRVA